MSNETWWEELTKSAYRQFVPTSDDPDKRSEVETKNIREFFANIHRGDLTVSDDPSVIPAFEVNGRTFNVEYNRMNSSKRIVISLVTDSICEDENGYLLDPRSPTLIPELIKGVQKLLNMEETNKTRVKVQQEQKAAIEAFNAARHPYVTYEYLEEKDFTNVIEMGKLGFRVISTYLVRGASEKEPRWLMERCSNNIQHKNPDGEETLPF